VPLHLLWLGYMSELLGLGPAPSLPQEERKGHPSLSLLSASASASASASVSAPVIPALPQPAGTMHAKLIKADFHGSIMTGEGGSFGTAVYLLCFSLRRGSEAKPRAGF
jgi:ribonuclease P protein subunit POP4